ncbi:hypothetical protein [Paractinoplanes abujensis]|uniref:SAF domain-containing protein n=1 Tax=Paractinoplanes abujensis TaxID=882441 RepID=A0A7W7CY84_9ACTN|nr:hypothetical protein [Actinoplanes abujensis]MBB4696679.1 hypothetical protein [Actinoplanes abujensis]
MRWRRPARGKLLRLVIVAILLVSAALTAWSPSSEGECAAPPAFTVPAVKTPTASAPVGQGGQVPAGSVGVPVRLADPAALALVEAGNRVDLLRLDEPAGTTTPVAESALVLRVTGSDDPAVGGLLLALTPDEAEHAVAQPGRSFAVMIRPEEPS